jgi:hypothetical protein
MILHRLVLRVRTGLGSGKMAGFCVSGVQLLGFIDRSSIA